jgi:hypothetical protein
MRTYLHMLIERLGSGWNRFWYTPSDPLVLSVLRVCVGLVATYTVFTYSFDLVDLLGPDGLIPASTMQSLQAGRFRFSYLDYVHGLGPLWTAHLLGLTVMALFTAGVATRVTSVLALIVFLSYVHRAILLTSQFEPIVAFLLFYLCLGPSGAYLSVDGRLAARRGSRGAGGTLPPSYGATIACRLIQIHVTVVYVMMALSKVSGVVWWNGTAAWWLMVNTRDTLLDLSSLRDLATSENSASGGTKGAIYLVNFWTHLIVVFELSFPLLAWNRLTRPLILAIGAAVWASIAVLTGLVSFALVMVVANLAFLSPDQMRSLLSVFGRRAAGGAGPTPAAK